MWYGYIGRFLRIAVALILTWAAAYYSGNEWFLALTPVLSSLAKYLRDEMGIDVKVL